MTERYFKKTYGDEYYIFDSETITEKEFEEKFDYEDYRAFEDSMMGDEVINRLNELHEENEQLKKQLESEHQMLENAILLERTRMGQNALKQFKEAIK